MKINDITKLELKANEIRQDIIKSLVSAGSGHSAGPLGMTNIFTALYFNILKHNSKNPNWKERDRLVLSNGHICPVLYTTMAHAGYFSKTKLKTLRKLGSSLQGHPHRTALKGLETTSGPLGCGLSQAAGMAYGLRMDNKKNRVFVLTSDGEHEEGNTWEGAMFAGKNKLNNLVQIMDRNNIQIDGNTEEIMPLEPLKEKYASFNWHVIEINGHDFNDIFNACNKAMTILNKPIIIIAHTIPGKGVSFMENDYTWHGKPPSVEQAKVALKELEHIKELIKKGGSL